MPGFWSSVAPAIGGAILGGVTGGLTDRITGKIDPAPRQQKVSRADIRMGHDEDTRSFKDRAQYSWEQAKGRGLTPQEFYGSSAAGGSASTGGAQVLGNSQDKANQISQSQHQETKERNKDRMVQLQQTKMQTDTSRAVAEIQSGTTKRGQDYTYDIANKNYKLAKQKLQQIELPKLQADLKISSQQFKKLSNEIATSKPKFMLYMKKLSMGLDNMMSEFLQQSFGIDITSKESVQGMTPSERAAFIQATAAINSTAFKTAAGLKKVGQDTFTQLFSTDKPDDYVHGSIHGSPKTNQPSTLGQQRQEHRKSLTY